MLLPSKGTNSLTIGEAKSYFETNIQNAFVLKKVMSKESLGTSTSPIDGKLPMWNSSILKNLPSGVNAVLAPMHKEGLYINVSNKKMIKFGFLNYMMMYKNSQGGIVTEWVELRPSDKWIDAKLSREYDGKILVRDWSGKIKKVYSFAGGVLFTKSQLNKLSAKSGSIMNTTSSNDVNCFVTTTTTITTIPAKSCGDSRYNHVSKRAWWRFAQSR